jgi:anhydro-N-acetylmuramic acid kinase
VSGHFPDYARRPVRHVVGLMSGTSADGVDAAVCAISGSGKSTQVRLLHFTCQPYDAEVRAEVLAVSQPPAGTVDRLCRLHYVLGEVFAQAALAALRGAGLSPADAHLIASHGQTVHHLPAADPLGRWLARSTLQLGEPAVIAQRTGVLTVANFRAADIAAGGQGAPLVPYADWVLLGDPQHDRAVQNIGGIANVTFLPAGGSLAEVVAFDTGPGNMLLDGAVRHFSGGARSYDTGGALAATGTPHPELLAWLMAHPFLAQPPPRSTGREAFGSEYLAAILAQAAARRLSEPDLLATLTAFTAASIADAYRRWLPRLPAEVILGGGGTHNATLRRMLAAALPGVALRTHADFGIPDDAKEAIAFALLGNEALLGVPANVPGATGARPAILGQICFP